ncbi:hypothetical protein DFS34DRAFT_678407 [Phlyctochytrium arcticum]|nr:hypothetical protein DFS34DRAFT_678407 [Phlyctochytrium arcticum]
MSTKRVIRDNEVVKKDAKRPRSTKEVIEGGLSDKCAEVDGPQRRRCTDVRWRAVNISQIIRLVLRDIVLDQQEPANMRNFDDNEAVTQVTLKNGLLVTPVIPNQYACYIDRLTWQAFIAKVASNHLWDSVTDIPTAEYLKVIQTLEKHILLEGEGLELSELSKLKADEQVVVQNILPHITVNPPPPESEPSHTAKYVVPHFNRLVGKQLKIKYDSTMLDRKRPDISITLGNSRPILLGELKSPHATTGKRALQLAEGLMRALAHLKDDSRRYDWGGKTPSIFAAIAADGIHFRIFQICYVSPHPVFIWIGQVPVVTSFETVPFGPFAGRVRLSQKIFGSARCRNRQLKTAP